MSKETPKLQRVVSPAATLRAMTAGTVIRIPTRDIKTPSIRTAANRLKSYGYLFTVTEKDLINETLVVCLKSPKS